MDILLYLKNSQWIYDDPAVTKAEIEPDDLIVIVGR